MDPQSSSSHKILSKRDALCLLDLTRSSLYCTTEEDFRKLFEDLKQLIPFDYAACLMGRISHNGLMTQYNSINLSYPYEWAYQYVVEKYHLIDPIIKENFSKYSLQYWCDTYKRNTPPKKFLMKADDFNLRNGISIGLRNYTATEGSLFSCLSDQIMIPRNWENRVTLQG